MESTRQNNSINAINNARMLLNDIRSNLSRNEINRIREKLDKKEVIYNHLKEQEDSLTNKAKKVLKNTDRYPKNIGMHLKNLKKHFKKLQKYQYDIDYLFNEDNKKDYTSNNDIKAINKHFLMRLEIIFLMKKQRKLEKSFIKKRLSIIF